MINDFRPGVVSRLAGLRFRIILSVLSVFLSVSPGLAQWTNIGTGIDYQQFTLTTPTNNNVFVTRMAVGNTNCIIGSMIASNYVSGARERVSAQASRYEDALNYWGQARGQRNDVVAAINGSFFNLTTGVITGGHIYDSWYAKRFGDWGGQMGFVWKLDRSYFIGVCLHYKPGEQTVTLGGGTRNFDDINVARGANQLILYTPQYNNNTLTDSTGVEVLVELSTPLMILTPPSTVTGTIKEVRVSQGSTKIPFDHMVLSGVGTAATFLQTYAHVGQSVAISQNFLLYDGPPGDLCSTADSRSFHKSYALAQGNFHFLKNRAIQPTTDAGMIKREPRTFVAYNASYVFFVVCDGRSAISGGMTSDEMGAFCTNVNYLAATDGVNMDGGGSSTMWLNGAVKNKPSDTAGERTVANGLMMVNLVPKTNSTVFAPGQSVRTIVSSNFRLGPGTDYFAFASLASGAQGTVVSHQIGGVRARSNFWWKCDFGGTNGWIAESSLAAPTNAPFIILQPSNHTILAGGSTNFTVAATGSNPIRYQWQKANVNLSNDGHYSGCTNATLTITGADANDAASYRCVVTNAYGSSNSIAATLTVLGPPSAPTANLATDVTNNSFTANWNSASGATGYRLDVSTNAGFSSYVSSYSNLNVGNVLSWSVSGLNGSTTHYYRLRAYNSYGTSGNSGTISVTTTVNPPSAPSATAATDVTSDGFTVNWNGEIGATGYRLDVSDDNGFASFASGYQNLDAGNVTNQSVTGLSASTTYYYRARAYNPGGTSGNSGTISVTTSDTPPPTLGHTRQDSEIVFSWPTTFAGYALEYATNLPPTDWTPAVPAPVIVGGQYFVTNTMTDVERYYRLKKP